MRDNTKKDFEFHEVTVYRIVDGVVNFFDTSVCCGDPTPTCEVPMEKVNATQILDASEEDSFAVEIRGMSMIDAGLEPGDMVIIRRSEDAEPGDIVLAYVNDEPYVKYLHIDGDGRKWLVPANKAYHPKLYGDEDKVEIKGVLSKVIKDKKRSNARLLGRLDKLCSEELTLLEEGKEHVSAFESLMCCNCVKERLQRMHELIDGKRGVNAFRVIKVAFDLCFFSQGPTYKQVIEEFGDIGYSSAYYEVMRNEVYEDEARPIREFLQ